MMVYVFVEGTRKANNRGGVFKRQYKYRLGFTMNSGEIKNQGRNRTNWHSFALPP